MTRHTAEYGAGSFLHSLVLPVGQQEEAICPSATSYAHLPVSLEPPSAQVRLSKWLSFASNASDEASAAWMEIEPRYLADHRASVDEALRNGAWDDQSGFELAEDIFGRSDGIPTARDFRSVVSTGFGDPSTYGEVTPAGARTLARALDIDSPDADDVVFMDLGSGVGKLVVQAFLEWPSVRRAVGVELSSSRSAHARRAWQHLLDSQARPRGSGRLRWLISQGQDERETFHLT